MFKNLSLNKKLSFILGLLAFGAITIACLGIYNMSQLNQAIVTITSADVPKLQNIYRIRGEFRKMAIFQSQFLLEDEDQAAKAELGKALDELNDTMSKALDESVAHARAEAKDEWVAVRSHYDTWWKKGVEGRKLELAGDAKGAVTALKEQKKIRVDAEKYLENVVKINEGVLKAESEHTLALYESSRIFMIIFSFAAILAASLLAYFVLRALNQAIQEVIASLTEGAVQVSSAAQQIAASSQELSQSSTEQAASLEETAASIEEMSSMVQKNSENAKATAQTTSTSQQSAADGKQAVERMVQSMDAINDSNNVIMQQIEHSNNQIGEIVKVIEEIGNKTKVINDIVFQTKLLSFNASVEAARAGEHGKGFAVVAEEVGNLAAMSGRSAKEITDLLDSSTQKVESIVQETKSKVGTLIAEGKVKVEEGTKVAQQCGGILEEIVKSVSSVSQMSTEIATASQEQSRGVSEISKAMSQLDQTTQANTAASEQCASAAEQLSAQSQTLKSTVGVLVATINGAGAMHGDPAPVAKETRQYRKENVVALKPKAPAAAPAPQLKKVVGGVPSYDHQGFEEV